MGNACCSQQARQESTQTFTLHHSNLHFEQFDSSKSDQIQEIQSHPLTRETDDYAPPPFQNSVIFQQANLTTHKYIEQDVDFPSFESFPNHANSQDIHLFPPSDQKQLLQIETDQQHQESPPMNIDDLQKIKSCPVRSGGRSKDIESKPQSSKQGFRVSPDMFVNRKFGSYGKEYRITKAIGSGSYGEVWMVQHKTTGVTKVLKSMRKKDIPKEEHEPLLAEVRLLKTLDHPNIMKLHEYYEDQACYHLICEYLSGGPLLSRSQQMREPQVAEIMSQILYAVSYCHDKRLVHRDLKPQNILFVKEGHNQIKIIDFGTARLFEVQKPITEFIGTPYYIAPEVISRSYSFKCDIWSCGVIAYQLLSGQLPFTGHTEEIYNKIRTGKLGFNKKIWDLISAPAKQFVMRLLQMDPDKRPTGKEALEDPWITQMKNQSKCERYQVNLPQSPRKRITLREMILVYFAAQIVEAHDLIVLQQQFITLDKNKNGSISKEELMQSNPKVLRNRLTEIQAYVTDVDLNNSGEIDFTEFIVSSVKQTGLLNEEGVVKIFKSFDSQNKGYLIKSDFEKSLGKISDEVWTEFTEECRSRFNFKNSITKEQLYLVLTSLP